MAELPPSVLAWSEGGEYVVIGGRRIFTRSLGGSGPTVVLVHGFPGSSFDWRGVAGLLAGRYRVVCLDLLGYGLSDKPSSARYSLFEQASLVEAVLDALAVEECVLVSHDMGDTVVAELLHRHVHGELSFGVSAAIITNGSIFIDMVRLSRGQRLLLALPDRRSPLPFPKALLLRSLRESFARECLPEAGELEAMAALIRHRGGDRLLARQCRYIQERRRHQERWTAGFVDYPGPLAAFWGERDPIALPAMVDRLSELRPHTTVVRWSEVSHWPSVETPGLVAAAIDGQIRRFGPSVPGQTGTGPG